MPLAIGEPYREHSKAKTKQNAVQAAFFSRLFRRCSFNTYVDGGTQAPKHGIWLGKEKASQK